MGSGTPIAQGTPATPQSVPEGRFVPESTPFQARLARSQAGTGPLTRLINFVPFESGAGVLPSAAPPSAERSPEQLAFEQQVAQAQAGGISSPPPSSFDGFAGIPNPEPGDIDFTGDSGLSPDVLAEQQNFFNNLTLDDLLISPELQIVPQDGLIPIDEAAVLPEITRQFDPPTPAPAPPPPPALSSNAAEAQQQINAANILQALETQTPGSVSKEKLGFASQVLKENFDRKRGDTTFDAFNPSSLGSGVKVAGLGSVIDSVVNFLTPEDRLAQSRRRVAEAEARKRQGISPGGLQRAQEAAALTNRASGGVSGPVVPNVELGGNLVPSSQEVIRAFTAPDGKGGLKPRRSVFDVLFNSDPPPPKVVPSTTVQIPLGIRDKLLDDAQGRARGGLVGLMRKGN